jgi:uncharacterized membrane protein HdeD (DUF308 family)
MDTNRKKDIVLVQQILRYTFGIVPIVAGLDKFSNLLVDWVMYLNPLVVRILPITAEGFMHIVGIIEIIAGIIVFAKTKIGSAIVSIWLVLIALNLIMQGTFFDIAVRDLVMAISAFGLMRLTLAVEENR